jgi:hypothetical protein
LFESVRIRASRAGISRRLWAFSIEASLALATAEEVVFIAAGAVGAAQGADEKHRNARRYNHGANNSVCSKPMEKAMHIQSPHVTASKIQPSRPASRRDKRSSERRSSDEKSVPLKKFSCHLLLLGE